MGRAKRRKTIKKQTKEEDDYSSDDTPNPESDDFFHDEVDKFHKNRDKIMLEEGHESEEEESDDDDAESIIGLDLEESEDDLDDDDDDDDDSEESDEQSKLPSDKSWGKKKSTFYSADTADADVGSDEEAWELEKQEEEAALVLQQRMAAALDEEDFDVANFEIPIDEEKEDDESKIKKTVAIDLSKLSKEQKLEILFRDSPELFELLEEFKEKLEEDSSVLSPLNQLAKLGKMPSEGAKYIELKHQLYLNYCINIGFYLLMKAKQTPVKGHPVIERIVQHRMLIKELEPLDKGLESDIKILLANKDALLKQSDSVEVDNTQNVSQKTKTKKTLKNKQKKVLQTKTKLSALLDDSEGENVQEEENEPPNKKLKKKKYVEEYSDPLEYYEKVRLEKRKAKEMKNMVARLAHEPGFEENDTEGNEDVKRAITYQISKNKGLTARKKRQDRNPRVKHRKKYTKAVIKRKSQVRPVTNEATRYEGEKSGIRAFLTRSVKIK